MGSAPGALGQLHMIILLLNVHVAMPAESHSKKEFLATLVLEKLSAPT